MNRSEQFVYDLTQRACLRLWTYPSPQGKGPGKELCDILVACAPDVIIFSVKQIELKHDVDRLHLVIERWKRKAVVASVHQVYGAVRRLEAVDNITAGDGKTSISLGRGDTRRVHRIAVAIGGEDLVPLESRDYGQGFVHIFSGDTLLTVMEELDTISDLVQYLVNRQDFLTNGRGGTLVASESDLLAVYVMNVRSFAPLLGSERDLTIVSGVWDEFIASPEYAARAEANARSYVWDRLIGTLHEDHLNDNMEFGGDLNSVDQVTRMMARENRTERRALSQAFVEFMEAAHLRSRLVMSSSGTTYVFLKTPHVEEREHRTRELQLRAWIALEEMHKQGRVGPVVGIATEVREPGSGFSLDALLLQKPEWTSDDIAFVNAMRADLNLFSNAVPKHTWVDEFPST